LPIIFYCDFEALNLPISSCKPNPTNSYTEKKFKQDVCSYGLYINFDYSNLCLSIYDSYTGLDAKEKFFETIINYFDHICKQIQLL
jgi:hypothetical protein